MTNEKILKKAIEKAVKGGWEAEHWAKGIMCECNIITTRYNYYKFIFLHSFAKAFWGGDTITIPLVSMIAWQYHIQIMVLEKEPLKYLERFIKC